MGPLRMISLFTSCTLASHSDFPRMVRIPGGPLLMGTHTPLNGTADGSPIALPGRALGDYDERPVTNRTVLPFLLSATEVTNNNNDNNDNNNNNNNTRLCFLVRNNEPPNECSPYIPLLPLECIPLSNTPK